MQTKTVYTVNSVWHAILPKLNFQRFENMVAVVQVQKLFEYGKLTLP